MKQTIDQIVDLVTASQMLSGNPTINQFDKIELGIRASISHQTLRGQKPEKLKSTLSNGYELFVNIYDQEFIEKRFMPILFKYLKQRQSGKLVTSYEYRKKEEANKSSRRNY